MLNYQQLQVTDFSGGITDKVTGSSVGTFEEINCMVINALNKLETTYGFRCLVDNPAGTTQKIKHIAQVGSDYIVITNNHVYQLNITSETLTLIKNFGLLSDNLEVFSNEWRKQLIFGHTPYKRDNIYKELFRVYDIDNAGTRQFVAWKCGLPKFSGASATPNGSGTAIYRYKVIYIHEYTTYDGVSFREVGESQTITVTQDLIDSGHTVDLTNLAMPTDPDLDLSNIKIEIYRTKKNLDTYYKLDAYDGTTDHYTDDNEDSAIESAAVYYAQNNIEFGKPPKCACMKIIGNTGWYGDIWDGNDHKEYRLMQSIVGIPTAVHMSFYDDMESRIVGIGAVGSVPIIFTEKEIYRIEGQIAADGSGSLRKRLISTTAGCVSHNSIVETGNVIYWAGTDGFYMTDGYQVVPISTTSVFDISDRYASCTPNDYHTDNQGQPDTDIDNFRKRVYGVFLTRELRIKWAMTTGEYGHNNIFMVYNLRSKSFTTETCNDATYTAACPYADGFLRGDHLGNIYKHLPEYADGVNPTVGQPKVNWSYIELPVSIKTAGIDFNSSNVKKWVNTVSFTMQCRGKTSLGIKSFNDGSSQGLDMSGINFSDIVAWRDPSVLWRQENVAWRPAPVQYIKRRSPKRHLRCREKQIELLPTIAQIYSSTEYGKVNIEPVTQGKIDSFWVYLTAIDTDATPNQPFTWPQDIVGYSIRLSGDNYESDHAITSLDTVLNRVQIAGGVSVLTTPQQDFKVYGKLKRQFFTVESMVFSFAYMQDVGSEDTGKI